MIGLNERLMADAKERIDARNKSKEMMNNEFLILLRDLIKAEVEAGIASWQPGEDGYYGNNYEQEKEADKIFE